MTIPDKFWPHTAVEWVWAMIGVVGQAVFGFRFFLQWMHSEMHGESRIPISFWWMSVVGVLMTAAYCMYKEEFILLLGNGPQLVPYTRNLILIYRKKRREQDAIVA